MVFDGWRGTPQVALRQLPEPVLTDQHGSLFEQRRMLLKVSFDVVDGSRVRVIS